MIERLYRAVAPWINRALAPLGLCLWGLFESDDDADGLPINLRLTGVRIGRALRIEVR